MTATDSDSRPRFLTTAEVLDRLGIGRTKFYELRKELEEAGRPLRPIRIGYRTLRWPENEIDAYAESTRASAT